jgi:hypothetical protein
VLIFLFALSACRSGNPTPAQTALPSKVDQPSGVKIFTPQDGVYRLTSADLAPFDITPGSELTLLHRGVPQPVLVEGQGAQAALVFFGEAGSSPYSRENIYILQQGAMEQIAIPVSAQEGSVQAAPTLLPDPYSPDSLTPDSYISLSRSEENHQYLPQAEAGEHWFWAPLPAGGSQMVEVVLDDLAQAGQTPAHLRVGLYGSTQSPESPDHHVLVQINDIQVADEHWDGKGQHILEAEFDASLLREGANQVSIQAPGDTRSAAEMNSLDWVEIHFPRQLRAADDRLDFISPGGERILSGFRDSPAVYRISPGQPSGVSEFEKMEAAWQDSTVRLPTIQGERYAAVGAQGYLKPSRLESLAGDPDLRQGDRGADYLAIGPADLLAPLQPLLDYHQSQGLTAEALPVDAVYDQFNHGYPEPQAIQNLMKYAAQSWNPAPRYLLLVGDATYDPLGYVAPPEANRLPTFLVDTVFGGQTASDVDFVQLNDDPWPDLPTGRVPARTPDQVEAFVQKNLDYAQSSATAQRSIFAVADGQEASFELDAQAFLDQFASAYQTDLFTPPAGDASASLRVRDELENGHLLMAYFGHGSLNMWGKDKLFTTDDVATLSKADRLPVILNLTCLTGLYTHPKVESLAEALLLKPEGGAVALLAPSSLTLAVDQSFLTRPFAQALLESPQATLGELHLAARRQVDANQQGSRDVMLTFMLFGDPALRLK